MKDKTNKQSNLVHDSALYFFGMVGAVVYYVQQADGFWPIIGALIKAVFWPGFLVYDLLKFIGS